jgi:hypothetical protein
MGQWLIDIGADKALGVLIIVLSFYFGLKMFFMSRGPVEGVGVDKRARDEDGRFVADDPSTEVNEAYVGGKPKAKSLKTKKKVD